MKLHLNAALLGCSGAGSRRLRNCCSAGRSHAFSQRGSRLGTRHPLRHRDRACRRPCCGHAVDRVEQLPHGSRPAIAAAGPCRRGVGRQRDLARAYRFRSQRTGERRRQLAGVGRRRRVRRAAIARGSGLASVSALAADRAASMICSCRCASTMLLRVTPYGKAVRSPAVPAKAPAAQPSLAAAKLADALFKDFPGESGRTISVP